MELPPDGGFGWILCALTMLLCILQASYFAAYGVIYLDIVEHFQATKADVAWIGAITTLLSGVGGLIYSPLIKIYGARVIGLHAPIIAAIGYVSSAFVTDVRLLYFTLGFLPGAAVSCYSACSIILLQQWFSKRRPLALSLFYLGMSVGAFVWPPLLTFLIDLYAWRGSLIIAGGIHLHGLILIGFFRAVPSRPIQKMELELHEMDSRKHDLSVKAQNLRNEQAAQQDNITNTKPTVRTLLTDPTLYVFLFGAYTLAFSDIIPLSYLTTRGRMSGYTPTAAALLSSVLGATSGALRPFAGILGTWAGDKRVFLAGLSATMAGTFSVLSIFCETYALMMAYVVLYGLVSSIYLVNGLACMVDLWGREYISELTASNMLLCGLAFFSANILTGILLDRTNNPELIFVIGGSLQILSAVFFCTAAILKRRNTCKRR